MSLGEINLSFGVLDGNQGLVHIRKHSTTELYPSLRLTF
jgi:hypothetical protein